MTETPQQDRVNTEHLRDYSQLRRSLTDRKIAGVAGGLGRHLNVDPTILRVAFVVLCFFGGAGFVLYGAAWLLVPEDGQTEAAVTTNSSTRNGLLIGAAVLAGLLLIGDSWGGFWFPWPLAVIALVVFLVLKNRDSSASVPPPSTPYTQTPTGAWAGDTAQAGADTTTPPPGTETSTGTGEPTMHYAPQPPAPPWMPPTQQEYQPPAPKPDRGPKLFWITLALVAVALGSLWLYDVTAGSVVASAYPALALAVVGAMLVLGAWFGRPGGLIFLGTVAAIVLAVTSLANVSFGAENRIDVTPGTAAMVEDHYEVSAGRIFLDLTHVSDPEALDGRTIELEANAGEIVVLVPDDVNLDVTADVEVGGEAEVLGHRENGTDVTITRSDFAGSDAPDLDIEAQLLVGSIEVRQS